MEATLTLAPQAQNFNDNRRRQEFEKLWGQSRKRAYNLAFRLLENSTEAEDVTQDAFVRAWNSLDQYDRSRPFESWLFRIVTNLVIDRRRRQKRVPMYSLDAPLRGDSDEAPLVVEFADPDSNPETLLLNQHFAEPLQKALDALPVAYRNALILADVEDRSYQEIAEMTNVAIGTVRSRIHRARQLVRKSLAESAKRSASSSRKMSVPA